ncbi:MAG: hypothetical protein M0R74_00720 [Dehalococcoidia bacterium]|nr:hypothetical protein [Dehalococcoidia bacterium]
MFIPGARPRFAVPNTLTPLVLALLGIVASLVIWAAVSTRTLSNETSAAPLAATAESNISSVAYLVPAVRTAASGEVHNADILYVREPGNEEARAISEFPFPFGATGLRAHGDASPGGDRVAIVHGGPDPAQLSIVALPTGIRVLAERSVDLLSPLAWSSDGERLAAVRTVERDGVTEAQVIQFHAESGLTLDVATFETAHQVVPVGYSSGGNRLFIVVVDKSGSTLWVRHEGSQEKLHHFSPGPTRDWSLSPDGARLAFIDRLGVGTRTYAGKTLLIATGAITEAAPGGDQLGTAWRPGKAAADFGGPDGSLRLDAPEPGEAAYVLPLRWAPDGSMLVATIYSASRDLSGTGSELIQLVPDRSLSANGRELLSQEPGARFIGWVRGLE